jgi:hypothetical protein
MKKAKIVKGSEQLFAEQMVEYTLSAIESVRGRARKAMSDGDFISYSNLMFDLAALEATLPGTAQQLMNHLKKTA